MKWKEIKERIEWIDTYDCHPGEVAKCLQLLVEWMDKNVGKSPSELGEKYET